MRLLRRNEEASSRQRAIAFLMSFAWLAVFSLSSLGAFGDDDREPTLVTEVQIGADVDTPHSEVLALAARACAMNADYGVPFGFGRDCMVGPVNDPDSGSVECRIFRYTFICIGE